MVEFRESARVEEITRHDASRLNALFSRGNDCVGERASDRRESTAYIFETDVVVFCGFPFMRLEVCGDVGVHVGHVSNGYSYMLTVRKSDILQGAENAVLIDGFERLLHPLPF